MKIAAIVLAAGKGSRMQSQVHKQFLPLLGRPMIYYALKVMEEIADEVVLVTGEDEIEYCREEIVSRYGLRKIAAVIPGGKERYDSVYRGLRALRDADYVLIQDGARPCLTEEIAKRTLDDAIAFGASVAGMPVKDTIKVIDENGFAQSTPDRSTLWQVQTPQTFSFRLVKDAYERMQADTAKTIAITDDAMVVERYTGRRVKLTEGSYENLKVTTPDDLPAAENILRSYGFTEEEPGNE